MKLICSKRSHEHVWLEKRSSEKERNLSVLMHERHGIMQIYSTLTGPSAEGHGACTCVKDSALNLLRVFSLLGYQSFASNCPSLENFPAVVECLKSMIQMCFPGIRL